VDPVYTVKTFPLIYYIHTFICLKANVIYLDLYHIYSIIKYKYFGVTEEKDSLAVVHQGRLDHLPFFGLVGGSSDFFFKEESRYVCLA
jgi:hypothetical protein